MKNTKKQVARALVLGTVLVGGVSLGLSFYNEAQATGSSCISEVFSCPGWGTGNRVICHVNGNQQGAFCTCGTSSQCP
jgi:hypothetical protein